MVRVEGAAGLTFGVRGASSMLEKGRVHTGHVGYERESIGCYGCKSNHKEGELHGKRWYGCGTSLRLAALSDSQKRVSSEWV